MAVLKIILTFLISLVIAGTAMSHFKREYWWIRAFDFPRLQITAIGFILLISYSFLWSNNAGDYTVVALLVIALADQLAKIIPYTIFFPKKVITCKDPNGHHCFKLVVMNVLMENRNAELAMKILKDVDPDLIIALETDQWWVEQFQQLQSGFPFRVEVPKENTYGMILYSKYKLKDTAVKYLLSKEVPSIHTKVVVPGENYFRLYAVHPKPPFLGHSETSTKRDAELIMVGKETRNMDEPIVVAGDLNDVAWSYTTNLFQRFSELLDPRMGRGMFNTFNARHFLLRWPLDHVFHSDHFQVMNIQRLPYFGSDHFPIMIELCLKRSESYKQEEPEADEDDVELARDKVIRAKLDKD